MRHFLDAYRRHFDDCKHRDKGRDFTFCDCPIWAYGYLHEEAFRKSLRTCDWNEARRAIDRLLRGAELGSLADGRSSNPLAATAIDRYMRDAESRNLRESTLRSYRNTLDLLATFFAGQRIGDLDAIALGRFRSDRKIAPRTSRKELESLRAFFGWCVQRGWLKSNPAKILKAPRVEDVATLPLTGDEVQQLLKGCELLRGRGAEDTPYVRQKARALVLTLLYTGLRIGDASRLRRTALNTKTRYLSLRTTKTGVVVKLLVHKDAVTALDNLPAPQGNPDYYFWSGKGDPESPAKDCWKLISRVGKAAKIHCHPHRFRDTFAVELITTGSDLRTVQMLLGHDSVQTTEKHYAHFDPGHQHLLDSATAALDFNHPSRPLRVHTTKHRRRNP